MEFLQNPRMTSCSKTEITKSLIGPIDPEYLPTRYLLALGFDSLVIAYLCREC